VAAEPAIDLSTERLHIGDIAPTIAGTARGVGAAALLGAVLLASLNAEAFFRAYLTGFYFYLSLALGALVFVLIQHATRASWSVVIRRVAENISMALLPLVVLSLLLIVPMVLGWPDAIRRVYPWLDREFVLNDPVLDGKIGYLNIPFFVGRIVVCFGAWIALCVWFYRTSLRQDETGDDTLTLRMQRVAPPAILVFGLTLTIASVDLLMTLDPYWFSTIFGVYCFSGSFVGFMALLALVLYLLQSAGRLRRAVTTEHYHDVGKLIFAFIVFWAYIAYSQYMLIWYGNMPEETLWYVVRQNGPWLALSLLLLFGHFLAPFLALISRTPKRRVEWLIAAAIWVLFVHWADVFWLVAPRAAGPIGHDLGGPHVPVAPLTLLDLLQNLLCVIGIGGLVIGSVVSRMARASLIPERDPRLDLSLGFEND